MYESILTFWFEDTKPAMWWKKDKTFDRLIEEKFGGLVAKARRAEFHAWRDTAEGRLAEIILLDQFPRNIYRGAAEAFASDGMALALAQEAVRAGADQALPPVQRSFLYMPFMHSESLAIHEWAMQLFAAEGLEESYPFEVGHRDIIKRFGRYPHRNAALGRVSTPEEEQFLQQPGSGY